MIRKRNDFRFIMVGHSKGEHIIIHLAGMLKYRTYFMGLYMMQSNEKALQAGITAESFTMQIIFIML